MQKHGLDMATYFPNHVSLQVQDASYLVWKMCLAICVSSMVLLCAEIIAEGLDDISFCVIGPSEVCHIAQSITQKYSETLQSAKFGEVVVNMLAEDHTDPYSLV